VTRPRVADQERPAFLFATCQLGAERALKAELALRWPDFRFAYSRPGFLTFKLPADHDLALDFDLNCVFARCWGFSLGKVIAPTVDQRAKKLVEQIGRRPYDALHVWQRDTAAPGVRGFEPHITAEAQAAEAAIRRYWPDTMGSNQPARVAEPGQLVADCTLVEADEWWYGIHRAGTPDSCFPGALRELVLPPQAVSRAYLKMEEALAWSGLPLKAKDRIVEIGCAPGGASQALLARDLKVIGIDPAKVDPIVLAQPNFMHIQKRGTDVRRREFSHVDWLAVDVNVAPQFTLDMVEAIVTHPAVNIRGLLLTLKLLEWSLAEHVPDYLDRIRGWGYAHVRARQLPHNRQEICVTALKRKSPARTRRR
jgi:23S rRNA (cytidine2498-2'-O)-methyltransferase